jgi:hypothetical protein
MPIISPLPRTDLISRWRRDISWKERSSRSPSCTERSISRSDSITSKVANPAAIAGSFFEKADPCTTARTMELNTLSKIRLWVSTAPTGTWPPDNALASQQDVWVDAPMLVGDESAGASQPGLDLVGDKQRAVFVRQSSSAPCRYPSSGRT